MTREPWRALAALLLLAAGGPALACSLCAGKVAQRATFREEAGTPQARLVLYGVMAKSEINPQTGQGVAKFEVGQALRGRDQLDGKKSFEVPRYVPVDPKEPPKFLLFADVLARGEVDAYRGIPVKGPEAAEYVRKALALDPKDRVATLLFYFGYLENADPEVAADAFLEFAKAGDDDVGKVAPKLSPAKLRAWLRDPKVPAERLGLYAYLLGACGGAEDARHFEELLRKTDDERIVSAYDGVLGGYIHLRPADGWKLARTVLADGRQQDLVRIAVVRTLRFYMGSQPERVRAEVQACEAAVLQQGELADMAIEDLRKWKMWGLTAQVLAQHGRKGVDSPLVRGAILRYALQAPPDATLTAFVAERRKAEPDAVKDAEEALKAERPR